MTNMTKDNYAVIFSRLKDTNYWNWNVESSIKYLFMCLDLAIQEHPVKGYIAVFDMKGVGTQLIVSLVLMSFLVVGFDALNKIESGTFEEVLRLSTGRFALPTEGNTHSKLHLHFW